ncbi:glycosyl hydrolase family 65 protein [Sorangium sp. So ce315]|uniref:glycoside hydrolase family 65 protein n=1 Tax=Sorangium sp. So ce315 TaxID=3133299 RepID=UPI003F609A17
MPSLPDSAPVLMRGGPTCSAAASAPAAAATRLPAELHHRFRFIAIDGGLVAEAGDRAAALLDELLVMGARVAVLAPAEAVPDLARRLARGVRAGGRRRLFLGALGAAELHGFDRRGRAVALVGCAGPDADGGRAGPDADGGRSALAALVARVIAPLRIEPRDRLAISPDPGGGAPAAHAAGYGGALRDAPELAGAVHATAGPQRLCDILALQRELDRELGAHAAPRDAAWVIDEPGFDVAREHEIESLLAIANGYLGSRASLAEGSSVSRPATFIAGAFEPSADVSRVPELVIAPDWGRLSVVIEGEPFSVEKSRVLHHRRELDMRRGVLLRDCLRCGEGGHLARLHTLHAASLADRHVLMEAVSVNPLNFTGTIRVDAILSGDVKSASGAAHWERFAADATARSLTLIGRTHGGLVTAMTSHLQVLPEQAAEDAPPPEAAGGARCARTSDARSIAERCEVSVRVAERRSLFRTTTLHTSRDTAAPRQAGEALQAELSRRPVDDLLGEHARAWAERWRRADVEIDGAPKIERALRFALYHLIGAANPDDPRCSVGARGLSGEAYRGHVFWDTDIFLVPFYAHCYPEAARALLLYRHRTLPGARRKARALGYEGALYAWESADTGDETTPPLVVTPFGEVIRVLSGEQEHHISADVAYAAHAYARATGDLDFARGEGAEILIETARFWASRAEPGPDGRAHIQRVIGPDEYHEGVDDNAFTNWMARRNLRLAAAAVRRGDGRGDVLARLDVRPGEVERWCDVADRMALGIDPETGLIEQFAGYFRLAPFSIADCAVRSAPVDVLLGRERTQACQVVKQADVVQLLALLWSAVPARARRDNFLYYEPRTAHGSSLSPGVHALVAARLDLHALAERYFDQTADIDLGNTMGNAAGGVHIAAMGSLWQAVAFGVAGITRVPWSDGPGGPPRAPLDPADDEAIGIEPHLLPGWRHVKIPISWRGRALEIHVEDDAVEIAVEGSAPLPICALDAGAPARAVLAEPGRRYVARRAGGRFHPWEEVTT